MSWIKTAIQRLVGYYVKRPIQRFNVDNRARRVMDRDEERARAAPRHHSSREELQKVVTDHPEIVEEVQSNPKELLANLMKVRVVSRDFEGRKDATENWVRNEKRPSEDKAEEVDEHPVKEKKIEDEGHESDGPEKRLLPQRTRALPVPELGIEDPDNVPLGKISLRQAVGLINDRYKEPQKWTNKYIAKHYALEEKHVEMLLDNFKPFQIYLPSQHKEEEMPFFSLERLVLAQAPGLALPLRGPKEQPTRGLVDEDEENEKKKEEDTKAKGEEKDSRRE